ncbi:MAG: DNA-nicking Smr family endonuclease [Candidatus Midichloriaceae bacterium]|jgi:DNA-nicking Smr family endonuclease
MNNKYYLFDPEELTVWDKYVYDVEKFNSKNEDNNIATTKVAKNDTDNSKIANKEVIYSKIEPNKTVFRYEDDGLIFGNNKKIHRSLYKTINKGLYTISSKLDLHGYTKNEAHTLFVKFLHNSYVNNCRLLLIITGKGNNSLNKESIIKNNIFYWLENSEFYNKTLYINYAHKQHGGDGAIYLLLKRNKDK